MYDYREPISCHFRLHRLAIILFFFVNACSIVAADNQLPSAAQVFADFKAASGGSVWDTVTTVITDSTVKQGGLSGVDQSWQDISKGRYADKYSIAGVTAGDGYDGTKSWNVDASGVAQYQDSDEDTRSAVTSRYLVAMGYWYPQRATGLFSSVRQDAIGRKSCVVVTVNPDGGVPIDLWFGLSTHLMVRTVEKTARQTVTTDYGDYRKVDGIVLPYTDRVSTGDSKYDMTISAQSVQVNVPVPQSVFEAPAQTPSDYIFGNGLTSTTIPFKYSIGHIVVPLKINGRGPFDAILDTGGRLAFTPSFARQNQITANGRFPGAGTGPSTVNEGIATVSEITIGDVTIKGLSAIVVDMPTAPNTLLVGYEIFKRFAVQIDFDKLTITLTPLNKFHYSGGAAPVPLRFVGNIPEVAGSVDGVDGDFMIDTGSGNSIDLFPSFIKQNSLLARYHPIFSAISGYGIGGAQTAAIARASAFAVGPVVAHNPLIYLSNAAEGSFSDTSLAGNLGGGFLSKFNLTFDYDHQQIFFEPNSHYSDIDSYERLGTTFSGSERGCVVTDIIAGSPADIAGIKVGDIITEADGQKLDQTNGSLLENLILEPAGTTVTLTVHHGRDTRDLSLILKDLI
jgi:hypothetical protein